MIARRTALQVVASLLLVHPSRSQAIMTLSPQRTNPPIALNPQCRNLITIDFGAGACTVQTIRLQQGAIFVDVPVADLLSALKS